MDICRSCEVRSANWVISWTMAFFCHQELARKSPVKATMMHSEVRMRTLAPMERRMIFMSVS